MNFSYLSLITITGQDAAKFLQGQLTCDIYEIKPERDNFGAYCNQKGRVLAVFRIFFHENTYYLLLPKSILENTLVTLKKYAVFSKVSLNALDNLEPLSNNPFYKLITNFQDENHWQRFNIEKGIPTIYPETIATFTPHMLNLPELGAVSFTKGCYLGQEIIARTAYLGKSKRQIVRAKMITIENEFTPGDKLSADKKEVGNLVNIAKIADDQYQLMAVVQTNALSDNIYLKKNLIKII